MDLKFPWLAPTPGLDDTGRSWQAHAIHKQHPLHQSLVEEDILHPEVQRKEETHFIQRWKLAHIPGPNGGHTLGMQGACTGLLSVGTVIVLSPED